MTCQGLTASKWQSQDESTNQLINNPTVCDILSQQAETHSFFYSNNVEIYSIQQSTSDLGFEYLVLTWDVGFSPCCVAFCAYISLIRHNVSFILSAISLKQPGVFYVNCALKVSLG